MDASRRPDVDWLRVGAVYLLFVFHAGKVFDPAPFYHVRNDELSFAMLVVCGFIGLWHMPLLFLLAGWSADPEVHAWLVPHDPVPVWPLSAARRVKYLRTAVTEAAYIPLLVRELRHADIVHVFSASYASFLLAPVPAIAIAHALGKPVVLNYRSGEAPDHLRRSRLARRVIAGVDRNVVPSQFLVDVFAGFGIPSVIVPSATRRPRRTPAAGSAGSRIVPASFEPGASSSSSGALETKRPCASTR